MKALLPNATFSRRIARLRTSWRSVAASVFLILASTSIYRFWWENERLILEIFDRYPVYSNTAEQYSPQMPLYDFTGIKTFYRKTDLNELTAAIPAELEEKLLNALPQNLSVKAQRFVRPVLHLAEKYKVDPLWAMAIMWTESHFRHNAISSVGARGPMQIMPGTHQYLTRYVRRNKIELIDYRFQLNDISLRNLEFGMIYLRYLLNRFNGNFTFATVAYNMGPNRVRNRLTASRPVGTNNNYLRKVKKAYRFMLKRLNNS